MKPLLAVTSCSIGIVTLIVCGVLLWTHRVELFLVPGAWEAVLEARRSGEDLATPLTRLIRLQESGFSGGTRFTLQPVRSRDGGNVWLVCFEAKEHGETPGYPEYAADFWSHDFFRHRLLRDGGRLLEPAQTFFMQHAETARHAVHEGVPFDRVLVSDSHPRAIYDYELSLDRRGFVPHGFLGPHQPAAPFSWEPEEPEAFDEGRLSAFLHSSREGDLLRALLLIELSDADVPRARGLYEHPDPLVRARAVAVLGHEDRDDARLERILEDREPSVRLSAFYKLADRDGWERHALKLTSDPVPSLAELAHWYLTQSEDVTVARRSAVHLLQLRSPCAVEFGHHYLWSGFDYQGLSSPELANAVMEWLEESVERTTTEGVFLDLAGDLEFELSRLEAKHLSPLVPRLLSFYEAIDSRRDEEPFWNWNLAGTLRALVKLEDPGVDAAIVEQLRTEAEAAVYSASIVQEALLERVVPIRSLIDDFWRFDREWETGRSKDPDPANWQSASYALWLLAKWNIPPARDMLVGRIRSRNESVVEFDVLRDAYLTDDLRDHLLREGLQVDEAIDEEFSF